MDIIEFFSVGTVLIQLDCEWCGRVTRCTRWLPHSGSFLTEFPILSCIYRVSYNFPFLHCSRIITLLILLMFNFELQIHSYNIPEYVHNYSAHWSHRLTRCHTLSRFTSRLTLTSWRTHVGLQTFLLNFLYFLHNCHITLRTCGSSKLCSVNRAPGYRSTSPSHSWMQCSETRIWQCRTNIFSIPYIINCSILSLHPNAYISLPLLLSFSFIGCDWHKSTPTITCWVDPQCFFV